ncbi:hypothetical protein ACRN9J_07780 [Shewanella baltica]|uniref:hypothetical protein n=1 Tax=Shewanella TaxID=22 RepID=UPI00217E0B9E|nr:hypothetical protein [Shewanella baltica]MCS6176940.1 hypothetical protein [Shewanella baltica]MCS6236697.1 hypothetical protein [Shewanella baltica]MCS6260523.1 hypothetical protein [Shewanella baltica]MCS6271192.1 hypothetical protein [Shewanella baltica]
MYKFLILLLLTFYSKYVFPDETSWSVEKLPFDPGEEQIPSVVSESKLSVAYVMRHPIKKDTRLYFMLNDDSCKVDLSAVGMHFVYINNQKDLFMSSCWDASHRRFYSLSGGYLLINEFLNKKTVSIREIEPTSGLASINQKFSAENFENSFYSYNKKSSH